MEVGRYKGKREMGWQKRGKGKKETQRGVGGLKGRNQKQGVCLGGCTGLPWETTRNT